MLRGVSLPRKCILDGRELVLGVNGNMLFSEDTQCSPLD